MTEILAVFPISLVVILIVITIERFWPNINAYHLLLFFRALGNGLAKKVHPIGRQSDANQQQIAGTLATITIIFPFILLFFSLRKIVAFPYLLDALIVYICLQVTSTRQALHNMCNALDNQHNSLAKAKLTPWVLRQTNRLSPMGMNKAAIESMMLRANKELFAVILYYFCFGSLMVLAFRMLTMLNQSWNTKIPHFNHFGKPCRLVCYYLEWLPSRLLSLTIMTLNRFKLSFQLMANANQWGNNNSLMILTATAAALKVDLGGPVIYQNHKIRRPVIGNNSTIEPKTIHVRQAIQLIDRALLVWLLMMLLISLCYMAVFIPTSLSIPVYDLLNSN